MSAEVYSATRPPAPYRAWIIASLLLLIASALAGDMVQRGTGLWTAGSLVHPQGWEMAFRPPAQFREVDSDPRFFSSTYVFEHRGQDGRNVRITFWRLRAGDASAVRGTGTILETSRSWLSMLLGPPPTSSVGFLGNQNALEVLDPAIPQIVLRTLVSKSGWAYSVAMRVEGSPIDQPIYALFDRTCRSVRFLDPDA